MSARPAALIYAAQSWPVLPCWWPAQDGCACGDPSCSNIAKHPIGLLARHGVKNASVDPRVIADWWRRCPRANVGLAAGIAWWVLDVDGDAGRATLAELEQCNGPLPSTPAAITGSGGLHLFFALPTGRTIQNSVRRLGPGVDTRARGGYVVAAPSLHASGQRYRWAAGLGPSDLPLAEPPGWMVELLDPPSAPRALIELPSGRGCAGAYASAALERELRRVADAIPGDEAGRGRNHSLYVASRSLGELCAAGLLDAAAVASSLAAVALASGLDRLEVERTLASGLRAGLAKPREQRNG